MEEKDNVVGRHHEQDSDTPSTSELVLCPEEAPVWKPTPRLYAIVVGLGIANLLAALENNVVAIAAPVILTDLKVGVDFVWITNAFFLSR